MRKEAVLWALFACPVSFIDDNSIDGAVNEEGYF